MKKLNVTILMAALSLAVSCIPESLPSKDENSEFEEEVKAGVEIRINNGTKGEVRAGESDVRDFTIFQFKLDGSLYRDYYFSGADSDVSVSGKSGTVYRFCAVMNMGDRRGELPDISGLSSFVYSLSSMRNLDSSEGLPMSCEVCELDFGDGSPSIRLEFTRLVMRLDFRLSTASVKEGAFAIKSVRIRQSASSVRPFVDGSRAASQSDVFDGDCADQSDIEALMRGESISLYALENCQGDLLSGNSDPKLKLPSGIPGKSGVCTYLEILADYSKNDGSMVSGNTYRMFLGKDNCSNFDLTRNTVNNVSLSLSDWSGSENYWKAEWDVTYKTLPVVTLDVSDVEVGGTVQAVAVAEFADGSRDSDPLHFEWISSGPVSVNAEGVVSGLGNGTFTLNARYLRAPVEADATARSQEFAQCEFIFGGFYDILGLDEDLSGESGVRYENGEVTVTMSDDFGYSVSCTCDYTVGILGNRYVSFESGTSHQSTGKIVNGGYVFQTVTSTHGSPFMAPGSDVPIYLKDMNSLISEEVGIEFN